jgi:hypothetical protein
MRRDRVSGLGDGGPLLQGRAVVRQHARIGGRGVAGQELRRESTYDEAAAGGFFVRASAGGPSLVVPWWKGRGSSVDFTSPAASDWLAGRLRALLAESEAVTASGAREPVIGGFKADGGTTS